MKKKVLQRALLEAKVELLRCVTTSLAQGAPVETLAALQIVGGGALKVTAGAIDFYNANVDPPHKLQHVEKITEPINKTGTALWAAAAVEEGGKAIQDILRARAGVPRPPQTYDVMPGPHSSSVSETVSNSGLGGGELAALAGAGLLGAGASRALGAGAAGAVGADIAAGAGAGGAAAAAVDVGAALGLGAAAWYTRQELPRVLPALVDAKLNEASPGTARLNLWAVIAARLSQVGISPGEVASWAIPGGALVNLLSGGNLAGGMDAPLPGDVAEQRRRDANRAATPPSPLPGDVAEQRRRDANRAAADEQSRRDAANARRYAE